MREPREVVLTAPAKVNLHLGIYPGRDERGYHRADSLMAALELADIVRVREVDGVASAASREVSAGASAGVAENPIEPVVTMTFADGLPPMDVPPRSNTVYKAIMNLAANLAPRDACGEAGANLSPRDDRGEANLAPCDARVTSLQVTVEKHVPSQAGLGGSSSDAASVLLALCKLWGLDRDDPRVVEAARQTGADVPFFLDGRPALLVGAGDVLSRTYEVPGSRGASRDEVPGSTEAVPVVLVKPEAGISTVTAYRAFDEKPEEPQRPDAMGAALAENDVPAMAAALYNNLGAVAERMVPAVGEALAWLRRRQGVLGAQVSGSGSCVFALCESHKAAEVAARKANDEKSWWSCATCLGEGARFC